MIVTNGLKEKLWSHATTRPWCMYDIAGPLKSYQYYSELFDIGGGYYFVTPSVFKDYMEDIINPTEDERNYLKLLMSDIAWCYWFDWSNFREIARNDIETHHYAANKVYKRRCNILHSYGWE